MTPTERTKLDFTCDGISRAVAELRGSTFQTLSGWLTRGVAVLRTLAPYAAIELLLPGGSLIALGLWLFQRKAKRKTPMHANSLVRAAVIAPGPEFGVPNTDFR